jgi:uncharacterized protein (DUF2252 family)
MSASPFAFFRGGAAIMAADLATTPRTGIRTQLCGDAHLANFGGYGTPERNLVFDVNDFDETLPGPFEWDVKRLAASFVVAGRGNGFSRHVNRRAVLCLVRSYRKAMADFGDQPYLATWYARLASSTIEQALPRKRRGVFEEEVRRITTKDPLRLTGKMTLGTGGDLRIRSQRPLVYRLGELPDVDEKGLRETIEKAIRAYRKTLPLDRHHLPDRYRVVDAAHKVVGVGSVGLRAFIVLLRVGRTTICSCCRSRRRRPPSSRRISAGASSVGPASAWSRASA